MNPENTIKCLIPQSIIDNLPPGRREDVAGMIVRFFKEANPELYNRLGALDSLTEDITAECVGKIRFAALEAHKFYLAAHKFIPENDY